MMDYNSDEDNFGMTNRCNELFLKTNNDLQNNVQIEDVREEQRSVPVIRVEATNPTQNRSMIRNQKLPSPKPMNVETQPIDLATPA